MDQGGKGGGEKGARARVLSTSLHDASISSSPQSCKEVVNVTPIILGVRIWATFGEGGGSREREVSSTGFSGIPVILPLLSWVVHEFVFFVRIYLLSYLLKMCAFFFRKGFLPQPKI